MKNKRTKTIIKLIFLAFVVIAGITVYLNRIWIYDFYRSKIYQPSAEMVSIRESLNLTDYGKFLFDASHPTLNNEEDFNSNCQSNDEESAVLGCYTENNIYIYNITESRLKGIRELTTAHELLHAVYARLSAEQKDVLRPDLEKVYRDNQSILKDEISAYDSSEQLEEIFVRSGTEIKNLPDSLEKHFALLFHNQDKIADFYNSYIKVFRSLETELDNLKSEMDSINAQIESKTTEYEQRFNQLNDEIANFNNCASTTGCFNSEYAFTVRRNQLIAEQNNLNNLYNEIDNLIDEYNNRVEKYNANVLENENLQNIINSHVKMEEI